MVVDWDAGDEKKAVTVRLPVWLRDRAANAAEALRDVDGAPVNLSHLVSQALYNEVVRWEDEVNDGKPFPDAELKSGPGRGAMIGAWKRRLGG